jgi:hypothetical protein
MRIIPATIAALILKTALTINPEAAKANFQIPALEKQITQESLKAGGLLPQTDCITLATIKILGDLTIVALTNSSNPNTSSAYKQALRDLRIILESTYGHDDEDLKNATDSEIIALANQITSLTSYFSKDACRAPLPGLPRVFCARNQPCS